MKTLLIIAFTTFSFCVNAQDTINHNIGPHGGQLKFVQKYNVEVLSSFDRVLTYLFDKNLKPISNKNITGYIMFFYCDDASLNIKLQRMDDDGLFAELSALDYYYCILNLNIQGNIISTKFDNLSLLAEKK